MDARRGCIRCLRRRGSADGGNRPEQWSLFVHLAGSGQNLFRDMLVQERLGGANTRIGMKSLPHGVVM